MNVFGCTLTPDIIEAIAAHGEEDYPNEACGIVLGAKDGPALSDVKPLRNVQDRYHQMDPERFPRTARDAFRIDELQRMRMLEEADKAGLVERILYHSHPDAGAYFSPEDRAAAIVDGLELMPGVVNIVVSIRQGRRADMAAFLYDASARDFVEHRLPFEAPQAELPDLSGRAMEGREAARPIAPVGAGLVIRRLNGPERERVLDMVETRVDIDAAAAGLVRLFSQGGLSPLSGFMGSGDLSSIAATGRSLSGIAWRAPVTLDVPVEAEIPDAGVVALRHEGTDIAVMGVAQREENGRTARLSGPVYGVEPAKTPSAAEVRAELLRAGMNKVLAVVSETAARPKGYDGYLVRWGTSDARVFSVLPDTGSAWLDAAAAQNFGATHVLVDDAATAAQIRQSLAIEPVHSGT